jgi:hypothetical protein
VEFINLHTSVLDNEILATADDGPRSTWLHLLRYCIGQENGGRIEGAAKWPERKWLLLCRVAQSATQVATELWSWDDDTLVLWGYPLDKQKEVRAKRKAAQATNRKRWQNGSQSGSLSDKQSDNKSDTPSATPSATPSDSGREGNGREDKEGMEGKVAKPSLSDVLEYAREISLIEFEAERFFDHYQANGWKQSGRGRPPIKDWRAALRNWKRRGGEFGKNSGDAGVPVGPIPFNPNTPNAHTGGAVEAK